MPAAVKAEPEAATSASALTSEAAASSTPPTATSPAADDSASVIAPLGTLPPELGDEEFPTYSRPVYPFTMLDTTKARLRPLPQDKVFCTELEAEQALQEHGLNQGYKLEATWDRVLKRWWKCSTGSQCKYAVKVRKIDDGAWSVESGVQGMDQHSHGPSYRLGIFYWARHMTKEEIRWLRKCLELDRLKTIGELPALIKASRKRLGSNVSLPNPSVFDSVWYTFLVSHPKAIRERVRLASSLLWPHAPAPPVMPANPPAVEAPSADERAPLDVVRSIEPRTGTMTGSSAFVWYQHDRPLYPFLRLDPAKAQLLPPATGQVFEDQVEATFVLQEYALTQGYELKSDWGRPEARLQCQGAVGCPYRLIIRERRRMDVWDVVDCHQKHNHGPDLDIGHRHWSSGLNKSEAMHVRYRKQQHKLKTIEDARQEVEASRKRLHKDMPMPLVSDYEEVWTTRTEHERRLKRIRTSGTSLPSTAAVGATAAPVHSQGVVPSPALPQPASAATISINFTPPPASSLAQHNQQVHSATSQGALIGGLGQMILQLWPNGVQDPQGKVRAAVKAMLDHDMQQQQQQHP